MGTDDQPAFPIRDFWHLPTRRLGRTVTVYHQVDSTNSRAAAMAGRPGSDGLAFLADQQSAGRGQHGRSWLAPPRSSVLLSLLVYPPAAIARPVLLTAWAAVSVCEVVGRTTGLQPRIKWPNDILVDEKKVCGILIEQGRHGSQMATVVGIGLNVAQSADDFAHAGLPAATSLVLLGGKGSCDRPALKDGSKLSASPVNRAEEEDKTPRATIASTAARFTGLGEGLAPSFRAGRPDSDDIARLLITTLDDEYDRLCRDEHHALESRWADHLGLVGEQVVIECSGIRHTGRLTGATFTGVTLARPDKALLFLAPEVILHIERL